MTLTVLSAQPQLAIQRLNATQIQLSWLTNYPGFILQSSSNLVNSSWETVTNALVTNATDLVVILTLSSPSPHYFRLRTP